jgi:Ser/Thr protein kinase RdoA (MazF antagonist)
MEQMPGIHAKQYSPTLITDLAKHQARMHILGAEYAKKHKPTTTLNVLIEGYFINKIPLKKLRQQSIVDFLHRAQKFVVKLSPKLPQGFNHLDYDKTNTLSKNNKLSGILDFDDLSYSPIIVCLGYTLWDIAADSSDLHKLRLYLQTYCKIRKLKQLEIAYLKDILLFRNYAIGSMDVLLQGENSKDINKLLVLEQKILELDPKTLIP